MSNIISTDSNNEKDNILTQKEVDKKDESKNNNLNNEKEKFEDTSHAFKSYQESRLKFQSNFPSIFGNYSSSTSQKKDIFDVEFPDFFGDEKKDTKNKSIRDEKGFNNIIQNKIIQGSNE